MSNEDYLVEDPWGYKTNIEDHKRKEKILTVLSRQKSFNRALDIGAGEGWITQDLPADLKHAFEKSSNAKLRLPNNVTPVDFPFGEYDLVIATGVLYPQYDCDLFFRLIKDHASDIILTCNIKDWEHPNVTKIGTQIHEEEFPYREYIQKLRLFQV